jgi:hypothetical protein
MRTVTPLSSAVCVAAKLGQLDRRKKTDLEANPGLGQGGELDCRHMHVYREHKK